MGTYAPDDDYLMNLKTHSILNGNKSEINSFKGNFNFSSKNDPSGKEKGLSKGISKIFEPLINSIKVLSSILHINVYI